jgi:hypothetical protein
MSKTLAGKWMTGKQMTELNDSMETITVAFNLLYHNLTSKPSYIGDWFNEEDFHTIGEALVILGIEEQNIADPEEEDDEEAR